MCSHKAVAPAPAPVKEWSFLIQRRYRDKLSIQGQNDVIWIDEKVPQKKGGIEFARHREFWVYKETRLLFY